jgi:hypothetical protein
VERGGYLHLNNLTCNVLLRDIRVWRTGGSGFGITVLLAPDFAWGGNWCCGACERYPWDLLCFLPLASSYLSL